MCSRVDNGCKTFTTTILQLKAISKDILMEPRFDLVTTVDFLMKYLSKQYGCKIEILVKYD